MIKIKTEVNKSQIMRELKEEAIKSYEQTWQKDLQVRAYMNGVHDLFKKLRISEQEYADEQMKSSQPTEIREELKKYATWVYNSGNLYEIWDSLSDEAIDEYLTQNKQP